MAFVGTTYTLASASESKTFTGFKAASDSCMSGYSIASVSPAFVTLPTSTTAAVSIYSTNVAYYYANGAVTGTIYALKLDGVTTFSTAG